MLSQHFTLNMETSVGAWRASHLLLTTTTRTSRVAIFVYKFTPVPLL